jgi:hypothetical protein
MKRWRWSLFVVLTASALVGTSFYADSTVRWPIQRLTIRQLRASNPGFDSSNATVPESIAKLDGQKVEIIGGVWAPNDNGTFVLTEYIGDRYPPVAQEFVHVRMTSGALPSTNFSYDYNVIAHGTLHIKAELDASGVVSSIYWLDADWAKTDPSLPQQEPSPESSAWALVTIPIFLFALLVISAAIFIIRHQRCILWPQLDR